MPNPGLSDARRRLYKDTTDQCLREGYAPLGMHGAGGKGAVCEEVARRLGINSGTIHHWYRREKNGGTPFAPDESLYQVALPTPKAPLETAPPPPVIETRLLKLQDENARLRAELKTAHREAMDENSVRELLTGLAAAPVKVPDWIVALKHQTAGAPEVPITQWSDWHYGEVVLPSEVNGINEFNNEVFRRRMRMLVERTVDLCKNHHNIRGEYPGIVVVLGGDMISGMLHPELAENDESEINDQILEVAGFLIWGLKQMADQFGKVFVPCVPGNHGRQYDKKPRMKKYAHRNADWLVYQLLERHFHPRDAMTGEPLPGWDTRIELMIPDTGEALFSAYGVRFMVVHGDDLGVRGGDGIIGAIGPIMRGEIKLRHSQAEIGRDYDVVLLGHWHQTLYLKRAIVNNCLKGYDEFARRQLRAVPTAPSQNLFFVHPRRGITARWEVMLEDRPQSTAPWVSWESGK